VIASLTVDASGYFTTVPGINPTTRSPSGRHDAARVGMESYLTFTNVNGPMNISGTAPFKGIDKRRPRCAARWWTSTAATPARARRLPQQRGAFEQPRLLCGLPQHGDVEQQHLRRTHTDGKVYAQQPTT